LINLRFLEAEFCRFDHRPEGVFLPHGMAIEQAQGIMFLCPQCYDTNNGLVGTHRVLCWFKDRGVPDEATPGPGRWTVTGVGIDDLSLTPSVHLSGPGCGWHGYVKSGSAG
jgi:hypothetical protein